MYLQHFALTEAPFSIAPDPRYLYMSQRHKEALAHLLYGLGGDGGFVVLSGEVGAGKTTVCRCLLEQIPGTCDLAYVFNPRLTAVELLQTLCTEFAIDPPAERDSIKALVDAINGFLLTGHAQGRHAVLIIDEAQNLSADVLEQMRLLTNLETNQRKLLQIILVGQPELDALLARRDLRQLAQRVVARYHLDSLSRDEIEAYVRHRLQVAGCKRALFPSTLMGHLYRLTGGVPRLVNLLCDRALLGTYVEGRQAVTRRILLRAANEVLPVRLGKARRPWWPAAAVAGVAAFAAWGLGAHRTPTPSAVPTSHQAQATAANVAGRAPQIDRLEWPSNVPRGQSLALAFARLYRAWHAPMPLEGHCPTGAVLRCRTARGGLDELRQIGLPAVLYLADGKGQEFQATLLGLGRTDATLDIGGQPRRIGLAELGAAWGGRYTLLWHAPADLPDQIRPKTTGPAISWLAAQLAQVNGQPAPAHLPNAFDNALYEAVKHFQFAHGLTPDGQVGQQTLVRLGAAGDRSAPRLAPEAP